MSFKDIIKKSVLDGFQNNNITTTQIIITLGITFVIATYIFIIYRFIAKRVFYDKNFNVSMAIISVVTAGIILSMQSNLAISLGMVGALSIVRFRTAIKEPMDLLFLFWSIAVGIVCGSGLFELAIIISIFATIGIVIFQHIPTAKSPYLLIVNANNSEIEEQIIYCIKKYSKTYRIDSLNINASGMDMIVEIKSKNGSELLKDIIKIQGVRGASFLYHEGELKA